MRGRFRDRIQVYTTAKSIYFLEMPHSRTQNTKSLKFNLISPKHSGLRMSPIKPREMEVPVIGRALLPAHKTVGISGQAMRRRQFLLNYLSKSKEQRRS